MNIPAIPHYNSVFYNSKGRFCSYWHQISEIISLNPANILEIGVGSGFVRNYLKNLNMNIVTLDIDKRLSPDIVGSVTTLPFKQNSFDVIACFQMLEHLPYDFFYDTLREIFRVAKYFVILSLPDYSWAFRFNIVIPGGFRISKIISGPRLFSRKLKLGGEHYWEIGRSGYPLKKIIDVIERAEFNIEKTYRVYELPLHRFFKLRINKYNNVFP